MKKKIQLDKKRVISAILIVVLVLTAFFAIKTVAKNIVKTKQNETMSADLDEAMGADVSGYLQHNGQYFEQNEDITSILVMGVDSTGKLQPKNAVPGQFGQADTIMLVLLDKKNKEIRMINVVRDSMVNVTVFDKNGDYAETKNAQICLQYAYGDGGESSCQLTANSVSEMFYNMPINYYVALNKTAIQEINDTIGGVTVTMSEDWSIHEDGTDLNYTAGQKITLKGKEAMLFLFGRDETAMGTNMTRVTRQKDYLNALLPQLKSAAKEDIGIITKIYSATQGHMYSNIELSDMIGMATDALNGGYSFGEMQILPGQYVEGQKNDEYHIDSDAIYEMVIQNYYTSVDISEVMGTDEQNE